MLHNLAWENEMKGGGEGTGVQMGEGKRMGLGSLWDSVQGQPSWFFCPFVLL